MNLPNNILLQGGKYQIIRFISSGGFGCTYEAKLVLLNKRVAIKEFFVKDFCNRDENTSYVTVATQSKVKLVERLKKKFIEEANALFTIQHPNIVRVSDVFEENGTAYYVMDYIDGKSLHEMVKEKGALKEDLAISYINQIADALKYVHNLNRLHLDIKPGNIMINENNQAILIDFGASKQYDEVDGENTSTLLGKTPGYAPIEQISNNVKSFTPATDIYALGATLYKLLTGMTPPDATVIFNEGLKDLPKSLSDNIRTIVNKSMELRVKDRPQSIDDFVRLLVDRENKKNKEEKNDEENTLIDSSNVSINDHNVKSVKSSANTKILVLSIILIIIAGIIYIQNKSANETNVVVSEDSVVVVEEVPAIIEEQVAISNTFETKSLKENDLNINIQWPTSLVGVEHISHLQRLISKRIFNVESSDIDYLISNYRKQYDPNTEEILNFSMEQKINNIIIFKLHRYVDLNSGTGAGVSFNTIYLYYDTESEELFDIDKIIINKNSTINAINKHISLDEYHSRADFIPDNIILSMDGLTFVFPKYSIGYGYQGEVKVMVPYEDLVGCLSIDFLKAIGRQ